MCSILSFNKFSKRYNMQIEEPLIPRNHIFNGINVRGSRRLLLIFLLGIVAGFIFSAFFLWGINLDPNEDDYSLDFEENDEIFIPLQNNDHSRIMCLIVMRPEDNRISAELLEHTWGRRCNQIVITTSARDLRTNHTLLLPYDEEFNNLWNHTLVGLNYLFAIRRHEFEWVFKTDMNSFAILENLRYMLKNYSSLDPIYFGVRFGTKKKGPKTASYLMSKQALYQLHEETLTYDSKCRTQISKTDDENLELEKCLHISNVKAKDSLDTQGRHRFLTYLSTMPPIYYGKIIPLNHTNYVDHYASYSDYPVCFHFVPFEEMYQLEYMIYLLRPFGAVNPKQPIYETSSTTNINLVEKNITFKTTTLNSNL